MSDGPYITGRIAGARGAATVAAVRADGPTRIYRVTPEGAAEGRLAVIFANMVGATRQNLPFVWQVAASRTPALVVADLSNTFFAERGQADLIADEIGREMERRGVDEVSTLGYSQGAYAALAFGGQVAVARSLAFCPKAAAEPDILDDGLPSMARLRALRENAFPSPAPGIARIGRGWIVHGTRGFDLHHLDRLPEAPRMARIVVPGATHFIFRHPFCRGPLLEAAAAFLGGDDAGTAAHIARVGLPRGHPRAERALRQGRRRLARGRDAGLDHYSPTWRDRVRLAKDVARRGARRLSRRVAAEITTTPVQRETDR